MRLKRSVFIAAAITFCLVSSCTARQPEQQAKPIEGQEYGRLERLNVTTTPTIDTLTFRGLFRNPYDEPIEDIRVVLRITSDDNPTSPTLVRVQDVMKTQLEPGASAPFAITAKANPQTLIGVGMFLDGFAVRRGDEVLPISPAWEK